MTMVAGTPKDDAAQATPWAWFPAEEATTGQRSPRSIMAESLFVAPRILNEPVFCRFSHLRYTLPPHMREKVEERSSSVWCRMGLRRFEAAMISLSSGLMVSMWVTPYPSVL